MQRRAAAAAACGASSLLGASYYGEAPSLEAELPRAWDGAAIEAHWDARPWASLGRACTIAATLGPIAGRAVGDALRNRDGSTPRAAREAEVRAVAIRCREALVELGPAFIKLGQALSIRPDVVPAAALEELRSLCDAVPPASRESAVSTLVSEVGLEDVTKRLAGGAGAVMDAPVAAASLGQVYRATLDGRDVALKIQRPDVISKVSLDLALLRKWARFVEGVKGYVVPKQRPYDAALVDAFARGAWGELDYEDEARNQEFMAEALAEAPSRSLREDVFVPAVRLRSRKVIATDWVDGDQLCRATKAEIKRLVPLGVELFVWQLLDLGTYHCDPHPGNLLVDARGRLALIDFGLCTQIDYDSREALAKAVVHLIEGAVPALIDDAVELDFLPPDVDREALYPVLKRVFDDARLAAAATDLRDATAVAKRRKEFAAVAADLNDIFFNYPFRVPDFFALITRALIILEGIALSGDPDFDIFKAAYPHGLRRAEQLFGRDGLKEITKAAVLELAKRQRRRGDVAAAPPLPLSPAA